MRLLRELLDLGNPKWQGIGGIFQIIGVIVGVIGIIVAMLMGFAALNPSQSSSEVTSTPIVEQPPPTTTYTPTSIPLSDIPPSPTDTLFPTETVLPPATPTEFIDRNATAIAIQQATIDALNFQIQGSATAGAQMTVTNNTWQSRATTISPSQQPINAPVVATATPVYLCMAQITLESSSLLNVVRASPSQDGVFREPVQQGIEILVLAIVKETRTKVWYQIADAEGAYLGWIPAEYVILSTSCPE